MSSGDAATPSCDSQLSEVQHCAVRGGSLCDGRSMHRTPLRGRIERVLKHGNAHGSSVAEWHQEKQKAFRSLPDGSVPRCQFKGRQSSCILLEYDDEYE